MRTVLDALENAFRLYKIRAEDAIVQMSDEELCQEMPGGSNSIATVVWHISGNFESRYTEFLHSDGEKPWRRREEEFVARQTTKSAITEKWQRGWNALFTATSELTDADLARQVTVRRAPLTVCEALARSLAHAAYHVGQIVYAARSLRGDDWEFLSIAPGESAAYNRRLARARTTC